MSNKIVMEIHHRIAQAESILVTSHIRPDGDAVGSLLAVGLGVQSLGKKVDMVLADGVPSHFKFLRGTDQVKKKANGNYDLVITVDSATLDRTGHALDAISKVDINIDHHISNDKYATVNFVKGDSAATCELLAENWEELGFSYTPQIVDALITGILTDSQGFKVQSTKPKTLRIAADLYERGANLPMLSYEALTKRTFKAAAYWGYGLSNLQFEDGIIWTSLTIEAREKVNYLGKDDADLVNYLAAIEGAKIAIVLIEQDLSSVKISWRTKFDADVQSVASQFGGGGHRAAAGATVNGNIEEVQKVIIKATRESLGL
jgi:bifunctional oligoribonuclease and PAP phosphatase NrnA